MKNGKPLPEIPGRPISHLIYRSRDEKSIRKVTTMIRKVQSSEVAAVTWPAATTPTKFKCKAQHTKDIVTNTPEIRGNSFVTVRGSSSSSFDFLFALLEHGYTRGTLSGARKILPAHVERLTKLLPPEITAWTPFRPFHVNASE